VTFGVYPLRLHFAQGRPFQIRQGTLANLVRGQFGKILMRDHPTPTTATSPPRKHKAQAVSRSSKAFRIAGNGTFGHRGQPLRNARPPIDLFKEVFTRVACESLGATSLERAEGTERLDIPLQPGTGSITRVRVQFKTPTELKGVTEPFSPRYFPEFETA